MKMKNHLMKLALMLVTVVMLAGCDQAQQAADEAGANAKKAAEDAMESGKDMLGDLSEKAMGFLEPIKEKVSGLEGMADAPDKLKAEVEGLLSMLGDKAEGLELPEAVTKIIETLKEHLMGLKDYLADGTDAGKIGEYIEKIKEAVSGLKM